MASNLSEEETRAEIEEAFQDFWRWRQWPDRDDDEIASRIWRKVQGNAEEFENQFQQYLYKKRTGQLDLDVNPNHKIKYSHLHTISFVLDLKLIKKAWSRELMPRHFGMSGKVLALNYARCNKAIFEYIISHLKGRYSYFKNIIPSSVQCNYIELPTDYAIKPKNIPERKYGIRVKGTMNKYHNYLLIDFPAEAVIDGHSLSPVQGTKYEVERYVGYHSLADTIPLQCAYERPLNSFTGPDFNGPGMMKISYERKMKERIPPDQWFHRYVDASNHVQNFHFPVIEEIVFGDKPVPRDKFYWALRQMIINIGDLKRDFEERVNRGNPGFLEEHPDAFYWDHDQRLRYPRVFGSWTFEQRNVWDFLGDRYKNFLLNLRATGGEETMNFYMEQNAERFKRYNDLYHRYILPGYHFLQRRRLKSSDDSRWEAPRNFRIQENIYYASEYKLLPTQIVPYYRKVDIVYIASDEHYHEYEHDPGRVFPFISYCDPSFVYVFNSGWHHIFAFITATIETTKPLSEQFAGDSQFKHPQQFVEGVIPININ